jgi:hypothetical protein
MSAVNFPEINGETLIQKMSMKIVNSVAVNTSPYTYAQQVQNMGGSRWEANITLRPMTRTEALAFQAFMAGLKGQVGTFRLGNPLSTMSNAPTVSVNGGASAGAFAVPMQLSAGDSLVAGQEVQIADHLYIITDNASASATTTVGIQPALRDARSGGTVIVVNQPKGIWRMKKPEVEWSIDKSSMYSFSFSCCEAI